MNIFTTIKGWFGMLLASKAKEEFGVTPVISGTMEEFISQCSNIYTGNPDWIDEKNHIKTVNFAKSICSETARLVTLGISIDASGSRRADWIMEQINRIYFDLRHWVEYACAYGTVVIKPNGVSVDILMPGRFIVTDSQNGAITGAVFVDSQYINAQRKWYTRLEYHRFVNGGDKRFYAISNRCYIGNTKNDMRKAVRIGDTPWAGLQEDVLLENVEKPLFGVLRMPLANNVDINSPMGMPIFSEALEELRDLDVAYSRNAREIEDSKRLVILDSDRLLTAGNKIGQVNKRTIARGIGLPDYIKFVEGSGDRTEIYHEINPSLNTETRLMGINALLSQIGFKCGYSNGYFVFNEKGGMITATQVEADDRRTIQLIKDVRDKLEQCLDDLIYAFEKMADIYGYAPVGPVNVVYDFGDITYNQEEDRARWYSYVTAGRIPFWYYLVKFEGYTEEDAKALESEAQPKETLFGGEE